MRRKKSGKRWKAVITYRSDKTKQGVIVSRFFIEELEELQKIVEEGPNFYAIKKIMILNTHEDIGPVSVEYDG